MRLVIVLLTACTVAACGNQSLDTGVSPTSTSGNGSLASTAPIGSVNNSCSDQTTSWVTPHYSIDGGDIKGEWTPVFNVDTYRVQISYSRDGIQPWLVVATFDTNRTEFRYVDGENGGRYLVRVRLKNRCDGMGPWSEALRIYVGGGDGPGDAAPPPPPPRHLLRLRVVRSAIFFRHRHRHRHRRRRPRVVSAIFFRHRHRHRRRHRLRRLSTTTTMATTVTATTMTMTTIPTPAVARSACTTIGVTKRRNLRSGAMHGRCATHSVRTSGRERGVLTRRGPG